jgi:hypothetical protein
MAQQFTNNARSTITSTISASDTTLTVQSAAADLFPVADVGTGSIPSANSWFKATLQDVSGNVEIIYVRTRNAGSAVFSNIIRAREGTTAREFIAGTIVGLRLTAADIGTVVGALDTIYNAIYPVGSIYTNAVNDTNPGTLLGFGTWTAFGAGRVAVGFNASDSLFDAAEKTGGSKDAIVVEHTHTGTTGNQSADHSHTFSGTTSYVGNHSHSQVGVNSLSGVSSGSGAASGATTNTGGGGAHDHTYSGTTSGMSTSHNHAFTTGSTGSSGTDANLQPFITVYMWKRTA